MTTTCWSKNPDEMHGPVVAIWTAQPSGNRVPLCKPCLDGWLDNADDEPDLEPAHLEWLVIPKDLLHERMAQLLREAGHTGGFSRGAPPLDTRLNLFLSPREVRPS